MSLFSRCIRLGLAALPIIGGAGWAFASETVPTFRSPVQFPTGPSGTHPYGLVAADLSGPTIGSAPDGYPDLVVVNGSVQVYGSAQHDDGPGSITILRNSGNWSNPATGFGNAQEIVLCNGCYPAEVVLPDLDDDGDLDIVVTVGYAQGKSSGPWGVYYLLNEGNADFGQPQFVPAPLPLRGVASYDLDKNDYPDVVAAVDGIAPAGLAPRFDYIYVFYASSDGSLQSAFPLSQQLDDNPGVINNDVVIEEFNLEHNYPGYRDIVTPGGLDIVSLFSNHGYQNFVLSNIAPPGTCEYEDEGFTSLASGKFGPGQTLGVAGFDSGLVTVLHSDGLGGLTFDCAGGTDVYNISPAGEPLLPEPLRGINAGHLNGGVKLDLVAAVSHTSVAFMLGLGDGKFQFEATGAPKPYFLNVGDPPPGEQNTSPVQAIIADVNQDGFGDIITSNHEIETVSVLLN